VTPALFDAPQQVGQGTLWGDTFEWATDPAGPDIIPADRDELGPVDELDEHDRATARQRALAAERHADVIAHRRECGNCIPGRLCRAGKTAESQYRSALALLTVMERGEI
jgi:hypothetical protein